MVNLSTVTVTGNTGPGDTVTDLLLEHVSKVEFDFDRSVVRISHGKPTKTFSMSLTGIFTLTSTINNNVAHMVISTAT